MATTKPPRAKVPHSGPTITVTQIKSSAHAKPKSRGTLRALGLGRIGKTNILPDRPEIRGMIARVPHLIEVTTSADASSPAKKQES
jgi:large subunit ribosomal protein L30